MDILIKKKNIYFSQPLEVVGNQKNHLNKVVRLFTQNMDKKITTILCTISLPTCTCMLITSYCFGIVHLRFLFLTQMGEFLFLYKYNFMPI